MRTSGSRGQQETECVPIEISCPQREHNTLTRAQWLDESFCYALILCWRAAERLRASGLQRLVMRRAGCAKRSRYSPGSTSSMREDIALCDSTIEVGVQNFFHSRAPYGSMP